VSGGRHVAVVGAGWAGLAAAVQAVSQGDRVTLYEMAARPGGRARRVDTARGSFDNGQHILIGAYTDTLALMRRVGADPQALLLRRPLSLRRPDGRGLSLPAGAPLPAFARGVLAARDWPWRDRLALLRTAAGWALRGFRCAPGLSVAQLCPGLPAVLCEELLEPLCVAALNTPAAQADAQVFLRVLRDALFAERGGADLLLPRAPLSALLPDPAWHWLQARGARCRAGHRVQRLARDGAGWRVDDEAVDAVVLACPALESARLAAPLNADWARRASALRYEPIVTAWLHDARLRLPQQMLALPCGADAPAQFVFDLGALGAEPGLYSFVASGAGAALADGLQRCGQALLRQAQQAFPGHFTGPAPGAPADPRTPPVLRHLAAERRATFACTPGLQRPPAQIAPGLLAAGDHVQGPYPATLEGAVRSGLAAARNLHVAGARAG